MQTLTIKHRRWLIVLAAVSMLVYLGIAIAVDAEQLWHGLRSLGLGGIALVLSCSLLNYGLRYWRWQSYLRALGHQLPVARHLAYYLGGFAFTVSPAKAGEAVRSLLLKSHGVSYGDSLAALFAERLLDVLAICALVALTAGGIPGYQTFSLIAIASLLLLSYLITLPQLPQWLTQYSQQHSGRLGTALAGLSKMLQASRLLLLPRRLYPALLISIIAWGAEGYALYWLAQALDVTLTPVTGTAIYAVSVLGGAASFFMPAGLGGMEAVMTALLHTAGAPLGSAFIITVLCRFATLWFAVLLGLLALCWLQLKNPPAPSHDEH